MPNGEGGRVAFKGGGEEGEAAVGGERIRPSDSDLLMCRLYESRGAAQPVGVPGSLSWSQIRNFSSRESRVDRVKKGWYSQNLPFLFKKKTLPPPGASPPPGLFRFAPVVANAPFLLQCDFSRSLDA